MTVSGTYVRTFDEATHALPDGMHMHADYPFVLPKIVGRAPDSITIEGRGEAKVTLSIRRDEKGGEFCALEWQHVQMGTFERLFSRPLTRLKLLPFKRLGTVNQIDATTPSACEGTWITYAPTDNLRWVSWEQHGDAEHDPDCRPVAWPPPPEVLAFWESGLGGGEGADAYCTVVALMRAPSEDAAATIVKKAWTPGVGEWRFNREYGKDVPPGERFPPPKWSIQLKRWPWTKEQP